MASAFFDQIPPDGKILVLDLGFLGDTIHLLPAARHVRACFPQAELSVMIATHILPLLEATPWIDHPLGYPRYPKGPKPWQDWGRLAAMRRARYDAVINLNGSDRSSILTRLTGAPLRLGRRPDDGGPWFWPALFTHAVHVPRGEEPVYRQNLKALHRAGFPAGEPNFDVSFPSRSIDKANHQLEELPSFVHVSPFANDDYKELPASLLVEFLQAFRSHNPELAIVLSCAPTERERNKMQHLLAALPFAPAKVFAGELDLLSLGAVLARARLHLGADSGALHLATLAGAPLLGWFRRYAAMKEWIPDRHGTRIVVGEASPDGLQGLTVEMLLEATREVLATTSESPK